MKIRKDSYSVHLHTHLNSNQICETVLHVTDIRKKIKKKNNQIHNDSERLEIALFSLSVSRKNLKMLLFAFQ